MDFLHRHRFALGLALVVGLLLLGRFAMRPDDAVNAPSRTERPASIESPSAKAQLPAAAGHASNSAPPADTSASAFGSLRGRVIDAVTRKPVRRFEVQFHGAQASEDGDEAPGARTFQTVDGRFEWEYLPPGNWTVTVRAPGYQRFKVADLALPKGEATPEIVLPLRPGRALRGRLYDEASSAGIAGGRVSFREAGTERFAKDWSTRVPVSSASDGSFVLDGVPPGRVTLEIGAQDYASRELDVSGSNTSTVEIALSAGGTLAGRLTSADGTTPVAGMVGLFHLDQGFGGTNRTGETGEFSFEHLSEGRYQLTGQAADGAATREVVLAHNQRVKGIVLALGAGSSIHGFVTGLRPEDMKRLSISLRRDDSGTPYAEARVDDRGAYVLHGVQPGRTVVVADVAMRRQISKTVEVPASSDITADLEFPTGARLSGRVTHGAKPAVGVWLTPQPAVEQPIFNYGTSTSNEGKYVIEDLAPGEYAIVIRGYRSRPVQVSGDTVFDIDVPFAQLAGRVLEDRGEIPVVGADVDIWPAEPGSARIRLHDRSNDFGQFELAGLESGDFLLTAYKPGYEMFRKRISYSSPVTGVTVRLRQEIGAQIRVRETASGKPLQQIFLIEKLGDRDGSRVDVHLDDAGQGYIPSALAGSTLSFSAMGYVPTMIRGWNGMSIDLQLERNTTR